MVEIEIDVWEIPADGREATVKAALEGAGWDPWASCAQNLPTPKVSIPGIGTIIHAEALPRPFSCGIDCCGLEGWSVSVQISEDK